MQGVTERIGVTERMATAGTGPDPAGYLRTTVDAPVDLHARANRRARARHTWSRPLWIIAICALIVVLRLGREAFIPLALAVLVAFVFSGLVETLRRWHIP